MAATQKSRIELNLRYVPAERSDFRRTDLTLFREWKEKEPKIAKSFKQGDAVMFVSRKGNRIALVFGEREEDERLFLSSLRLWVTSGAWDPRMIVEYAESAGITLANRKRFDEFFVAEAVEA